jgi:hypothetical protein
MTDQTTESIKQMMDDKAWVLELEEELVSLTPDVDAIEARLKQRGFRVESEEPTATGWYVEAAHRLMGRIKVQLDGAKLSVAPIGAERA